MQNSIKKRSSNSASPLFSQITGSYEFMEGAGEGRGGLGHFIAPSVTWGWQRCCAASLPVHVQVMRQYWVVGRTGAGVGSCNPPQVPKVWLIQDFTVVISGELQWHDNHGRTSVCAVPSVSVRNRTENYDAFKFCFEFLFPQESPLTRV